MKINGEAVALDKPILFTELLVMRKLPLEKIAVELNGNILPKALYSETVINDSDTIEVVSFVGGG